MNNISTPEAADNNGENASMKPVFEILTICWKDRFFRDPQAISEIVEMLLSQNNTSDQNPE